MQETRAFRRSLIANKIINIGLLRLWAKKKFELTLKTLTQISRTKTQSYGFSHVFFSSSNKKGTIFVIFLFIEFVNEVFIDEIIVLESLPRR